MATKDLKANKWMTQVVRRHLAKMIKNFALEYRRLIIRDQQGQKDHDKVA